VQIITEVQGMKDTIVELKQAIKDAAARQDQAKQDVKRIEKDMNEFKNNKDSKLQQLQVHIRSVQQLIVETSRPIESGREEARRYNQS
jgi:structural maintenance of chromosome 2